jgi:hypothetical protein
MRKNALPEIAAALRASMESQQITQTQLVKITGLQSRTIANLLNLGIGTLHAINILCGALGLDFTALLVEYLGFKNTPKTAQEAENENE